MAIKLKELRPQASRKGFASLREQPRVGFPPPADAGRQGEIIWFQAPERHPCLLYQALERHNMTQRWPRELIIDETRNLEFMAVSWGGLITKASHI